MYVNKLTTVLIALTATQVMAQEANKAVAPTPPVLTIGEMAERARLKRIADDAAKAAPPVPGAAAGMPAGMSIVPSTQIITNSAAPGSPSEKKPDEGRKAPVKKLPPPEFVPSILGIYRQNDVRTVELVESNGNARFARGQMTPSGWTVLAIGAKSVELGKIDPKSGAIKKVTLQVNGI